MTLSSAEEITCPRCGCPVPVRLYQSINVTVDPDLLDRVMDREINTFECGGCGQPVQVISPLLIHDMQRHWWFCLADPNTSGEDPESNARQFLDQIGKVLGKMNLPVTEFMQTYRFRLVYSMNELVELIGICEDGYEDRTLILLKFIDLLRQPPCPECQSPAGGAFYVPRRWIPPGQPDRDKMLSFITPCSGCDMVRNWSIPAQSYHEFSKVVDTWPEEVFPKKKAFVLSQETLLKLAHTLLTQLGKDPAEGEEA